MNLKKITTYSALFLLAFFYCFSIGTFKDVDMLRYFVNGFYMTNYGLEGVEGYPNQLFSLFLYLGYKLTNNWYGLSNILFLPLYLFGIYSLHKVLNYFIKHDYVSLGFTLLFLLTTRTIDFAFYFSSYIVYFFFFISIIYLAIYHSTKLYLIGFYFALSTLFRNQLITFLPFIPFIINPKLRKKDYLKTIVPLVVALIVVQVGYELVKSFTIQQKSEGINFYYYIKELNLLLIKTNLFTFKGIKLFFISNLTHYYFYLMLIPCFFMFNKNFASQNSFKPLLKVFLILAMFIYIMPAIVYVKLGLTRKDGVEYYYYLLSRYSFIMLPLLIAIYHFIIKEQPLIKLKNGLVCATVVVLFLPTLSLTKAHLLVKNSFTNISQKKELYGLDSAKIKNVLKNNFKENAFLTFNDWSTKIYIGSNIKSENHYTLEKNNIYHPQIDLVDGVILTDISHPYLIAKSHPRLNKGGIIFVKIYQENADKHISIYKKWDISKLK